MKTLLLYLLLLAVFGTVALVVAARVMRDRERAGREYRQSSAIPALRADRADQLPTPTSSVKP